MLAHKDTKVILAGSLPYDEMRLSEKSKLFLGKNTTVAEIVGMQRGRQQFGKRLSFVDFFGSITAADRSSKQKTRLL